MTTCKIENNTARLLGLPPTESYPAGLRLLPGLNNVPLEYMEELEAVCVTPEKKPNGEARPVRYPGREALSGLQIPVGIQKVDSRHNGPQITIYTDDQAGREEGVPMPLDLASYKDDVAVALVRSTRDKKALKAYAKDKRPAVAAEANARLAE